MARRWADLQRDITDDYGREDRGGGRHADSEHPKERLVGIAALAHELERSVVSIRRWERQGVLPPPPYRSVSHDRRGERRLFTPEIIEGVAEVFRRHRVGLRLDPRLRAIIRRDVDAVYAFHGHGGENYRPASSASSSGTPTARHRGARSAGVTRDSWSRLRGRVAGPT